MLHQYLRIKDCILDYIFVGGDLQHFRGLENAVDIMIMFASMGYEAGQCDAYIENVFNSQFSCFGDMVLKIDVTLGFYKYTGKQVL